MQVLLSRKIPLVCLTFTTFFSLIETFNLFAIAFGIIFNVDPVSTFKRTVLCKLELFLFFDDFLLDILYTFSMNDSF